MATLAADLGKLRQLALLHGIQSSYRDVDGVLQEASRESLIRALQVFGVPLDQPEQAARLLRDHRQARWQRVLEPVVVAWEGRLTVSLRVPAAALGTAFHAHLTLEDGTTHAFGGRLGDLPTERRLKVEGVHYALQQFNLRRRLPWGYHRFELDAVGWSGEAMVIAAPQRAYQGETAAARHLWGVFLPLYSLHRETSWGAGNFSDLSALMQWTARQGGNLVATLPLLAAMHLAEDPSPYSPASRLFWNEFYLDVTRIADLAGCEPARRLMESPEFRRQLDALRAQPLVDYRAQSGLQRQVLEKLSESFFAGDSPRRADLDRYCRKHPQVESYARFRALAERHGADWTRWPEPFRSGSAEAAAQSDPAYRYHLYAQWQTEEQLQAATAHARESDLLWYLDFPLGVNRDGFDVWCQRDVFALEASGGAPPDAFFTKGQNWGFPPLHPERLRRQGYRYLIDALRAHLHLARILRLDHVMGLYRLYWVPFGLSARQGVYVHYRMDELLAILTLESHRYQARIVGENLGTVPPEVDSALPRHGIDDMYVVQFELKMDPQQPLRPIGDSSVASLNTHDMPTFTAFLEGADVDERVDLDLLAAEDAESVRRQRKEQCRLLAEFLRRKGLLEGSGDDSQAVTEACLAYLAESPAAMVLLSLEDVWQETEPQNTPGTFKERPNWRRKARYRLEQIRELPEVLRMLRRVARGRRKAVEEERDAEG